MALAGHAGCSRHMDSLLLVVLRGLELKLLKLQLQSTITALYPQRSARNSQVPKRGALMPRSPDMARSIATYFRSKSIYALYDIPILFMPYIMQTIPCGPWGQDSREM